MPAMVLRGDLLNTIRKGNKVALAKVDPFKPYLNLYSSLLSLLNHEFPSTNKEIT